MIRKRFIDQHLYLAESKRFRGQGLFTQIDLKKGDVLIYLNEKDKFIQPSYMNDADMIHPTTYEKEELESIFRHYEKESTKNNIAVVDEYKWQVLLDIPAHTELTRRYGLLKWALFLICDIAGMNYHQFREFDTNRLYYSSFTCRQRLQLLSLQQSLIPFGYQLTFANPKS